MTKDLKVLSVKLPFSDVKRIPGNRSEFVRQAVAEKLACESGPAWRPKTATGRKLLKLHKQFLAEGGELLSAADVARELSQRLRGLTREDSHRQETAKSNYLTPPPLTAAQIRRIYGRSGKEEDRERQFGRAAFGAMPKAFRKGART